MKIRAEEHIGILLAMGGVSWAVFRLRMFLMYLSPQWMWTGPLQVCALGLLIWVHAKWRRSVAG